MTMMTDISLKPATLIREPGDEYADANRQWQGIPSLERAANGRLWAVWYSGGATEEPGNYLVLAAGADDVQTWSAPCAVVVPPDPSVRCFDPNLWHDPLGRLWLFWAQSADTFDGRVGVWAMTCPDSGSLAPAWSEPRRLANGIMMNKPTVLSGGEWLMPSAVWSNKEPKREDMAGERFSNVIVSNDDGATWRLRGGADVPDRWFDEHMVVERGDGTLWMLVRARHGVGEAVSADRGATWQANHALALPGPNSRFFIRRLQSGRILLVNHEPPGGWSCVTGQLAPPAEASPPFTRTNLTALLSDDDGRTWRGGLLLDGRAQVSYPDSVQAADGRIYVVYDRERHGAKEILLAVFTEEDILAGRPVSESALLQIIVNKAGEAS
jgi:hypothetical protein